MDPFLPDDRKVDAIRALLPATGAGIYLDALSAGPVLAETDRALREADDRDLRVGRGGPDHQEDAEQRREEAAAVVAAVLGVSPDGVVLGAGARGLLGAVLGVVVPPPTALVVVAGLDPPLAALARSWAERRGLPVSLLAGSAGRGDARVSGPVSDRPRTGGVGPDDVAASGAGPAVAASDGAGLGGAGPAVDVAPAGAMVLAPAVRADDGTREDVAALAARVHADGARLLVDVTLLAGVAPLALPATGADGAVLAADRWLLGPEGTAAAWLAPAPGSDAIAALRALVDPLPRRTALGLARSVGWLLMYAGLPWVLERTAGAARNLADALAAVPGVTVVTRPDRLAAVVAFRVAHWDPAEARRELGRRAFAILGEPAGDAVRAAVGAWTTTSELRRFVAAVAELAAHTPATLPPRPPLIVLSSSPAPGDPSDG